MFRQRPHRSRSAIAALAIMTGCFLYIASSLIDEISYDDSRGVGMNDNIQPGQRMLRVKYPSIDHSIISKEDKYLSSHADDVEPPRESFFQRMLRSSDDGDDSNINFLMARLSPSTNTNTVPQVTGPGASSHGPGPSLTGLSGQTFKFYGEQSHETGITYYNILASPKMQWNMAPYRWPSCPGGSDMYLGDTGFSFADNSGKSSSSALGSIINTFNNSNKQLRFRITRRDERECTWNYSRACLAGGSFVMNLGPTARDMFYPGDYSIKTNGDGEIRVVAYNTNKYCMRRTVNAGKEEEVEANANASSPRVNPKKKTPIDYLRDTVSTAMHPRECEAWIDKRERKDDLFSVNSDVSTVHVDTPYMQITIQVRQNKVATKKTCVYAGMNVWITNISPMLLEDTFHGVLEVNPADPSHAHRTLSYSSVEKHEVEGPFAFGT